MLRLLLAGLAILPFVTPQAYLPETMTDAIDASMFLNRFKTAAFAAGYGNLLSSPDFNGTIFAPIDSAFPPEDNQTIVPIPEINTTSNVNVSLDSTIPNPNKVSNPVSSIQMLAPIIAFHIVPGVFAYPLSELKQGEKLVSREGHSLTIDRTVPSVVHVYGGNPKLEPTNFATILQYQEIKGGKAALYVIDKVLSIPSGKA